MLRTAVLLPLFLVVACFDHAPTGPVVSALDDLGHGNWGSVSTGQDHTCALTTDGRAYCWGSDASGQLGVARADTVCNKYGLPCTLRPVAVETPLRFREISAGAQHTCAIAIDRSLGCWGDTSGGELGRYGPGTSAPTQVPSTLGFADVSAGYSHTCAVRTDGSGVCWGSNDRGQLGIGTTSASNLPVSIASGLKLASVSAGFGRTCARTTQGDVLCWGSVWQYSSGGLEFTVTQLRPRGVPGAPALSTVSVGSFTTCGTDEQGVAWCWEANPNGEMGNGSTFGSQQPTKVLGGLRFVDVSAGLIQTCAISETGAGYCWGDDTFGQLGISPRYLFERCGAQSLACSTRPVAVYGSQHFISIATGLGSHTCGVTTKSNLYCWGLGVSGQLGEGVPRYADATPILVRSPQ